MPPPHFHPHHHHHHGGHGGHGGFRRGGMQWSGFPGPWPGYYDQGYGPSVVIVEPAEPCYERDASGRLIRDATGQPIPCRRRVTSYAGLGNGTSSSALQGYYVLAGVAAVLLIGIGIVATRKPKPPSR